MIEQFQQYIEEVISRPDERFNGGPICPYARNARIQYVITDDFSSYNLLKQVKKWDDRTYEVLIVLFIREISCEALDKLCLEISGLCEDCEVFAGHPLSSMFTRRDPYPNLQFNRKALLEEFRAKLRSTDYYDCLKDGTIA